MLKLTFNPGLTLTGFRTTRPWSMSLWKKRVIKGLSIELREKIAQLVVYMLRTWNWNNDKFYLVLRKMFCYELQSFIS